MLLLLPLAVVLDARALVGALSRDGGLRLALLLLANGCAHATYNGVSFAVLRRVSTASHAVLNIVRRVVVIGASAAFFGTYVSPLNWAGVAVATAGVVGFGRSKQRGGGGTTRRGAVLLPVAREV